jgi:tetratricopeptide (TPR) repeat protein
MKRYPGLADSWFWSGMLEIKKSRPFLALDRYREALDRDPKHFPAMFNLGLVLYQQEHFPEAKEVWTQFVHLVKDDPTEAEYLSVAEKLLAEITRELDPETASRPF